MNAPISAATLRHPAFDLRAAFGTQCCRYDITHEDYHRDRSCVSASSLKHLLRSPAHYRAYLAGAYNKETPARRRGTAIHTRLLEPHRFASEYVIAPVGDRRTNEFKDFEAKHPGKHILTPDEWTMILGIEKSVSRHKTGQNLLNTGLIEHTLIWQDQNTGIWLKIRPDCIELDDSICLDVKSTENASPIAFRNACLSYDYDLQAAMYTEGLRQCFGRDFDFGFLAVEKEAPFAAALYGAPAEMLARGMRRFRKALSTLRVCLDTDQWPSYQPDGDFELLDWPKWAQ